MIYTETCYAWKLCQIQVPSHPPRVLGEAEYGGAGRRLIQSTLLWRERGHPGRPTGAHHFQCVGGHGGSPLVIPAGGGTGGGR